MLCDIKKKTVRMEAGMDPGEESEHGLYGWASQKSAKQEHSRNFSSMPSVLFYCFLHTRILVYILWHTQAPFGLDTNRAIHLTEVCN